jgi:hypothetical protein
LIFLCSGVDREEVSMGRRTMSARPLIGLLAIPGVRDDDRQRCGAGIAVPVDQVETVRTWSDDKLGLPKIDAERVVASAPPLASPA